MNGGFGTRLMHVDGVDVLMVSGDVDASTSAMFADACRRHAAAGQRLVLDLSGVTFMDSSGLSVLIGADGGHPGTLVVRSVSHQVDRLLRITDLAARFLEPPPMNAELAGVGDAFVDHADACGN